MSTATLKILRFNPTEDREPTYREYQVEVEPTLPPPALGSVNWKR